MKKFQKKKIANEAAKLEHCQAMKPMTESESVDRWRMQTRMMLTLSYAVALSALSKAKTFK